MSKLEEFYREIGADYDKAKAHISKDEMLIKYLKRFNGSEKIIQLREAVSTGSFSAAYISAEEIYEISKTLALTLIAEKSFVLVNALKDGDPGTDIGFLIDELEEILLRVQMKIKEKLL